MLCELQIGPSLVYVPSASDLPRLQMAALWALSRCSGFSVPVHSAMRLRLDPKPIKASVCCNPGATMMGLQWHDTSG